MTKPFSIFRLLTWKFGQPIFDIPKQFLRSFITRQTDFCHINKYFAFILTLILSSNNTFLHDSFSFIIISPPKLEISRKFKVYKECHNYQIIHMPAHKSHRKYVRMQCMVSHPQFSTNGVSVRRVTYQDLKPLVTVTLTQRFKTKL